MIILKLIRLIFRAMVAGISIPGMHANNPKMIAIGNAKKLSFHSKGTCSFKLRNVRENPTELAINSARAIGSERFCQLGLRGQKN